MRLCECEMTTRTQKLVRRMSSIQSLYPETQRLSFDSVCPFESSQGFVKNRTGFCDTDSVGWFPFLLRGQSNCRGDLTREINSFETHVSETMKG